MASDREQFASALKKWDTLQQEGEYSAPSDMGRVAILVSGYGMKEDLVERLKEVDSYQHEGYMLYNYLLEIGILSYVIERFNKYDMLEVLGDTETASIVTIGNGDLTSIFTSETRLIDWQLVADSTTHLKTGFFEQRHCGAASRNLSVPLGTFAMKSHSSVFAALNQGIPTVITPESQSAINRLHNYDRLTYQAVKTIFPQLQVEKDKTASE